MLKLIEKLDRKRRKYISSIDEILMDGDPNAEYSSGIYAGIIPLSVILKLSIMRKKISIVTFVRNSLIRFTVSLHKLGMYNPTTEIYSYDNTRIYVTCLITDKILNILELK